MEGLWKQARPVCLNCEPLKGLKTVREVAFTNDSRSSVVEGVHPNPFKAPLASSQSKSPSKHLLGVQVPN